MSHAILGLLMIYPMSLCDLVRGFESGISLFYSASTGSIKRALDRLLAEGHIEVEGAEPGPRGRKVYRVTESGREEFRTWMFGPLEGSSLETAEVPAGLEVLARYQRSTLDFGLSSTRHGLEWFRDLIQRETRRHTAPGDGR